MKVQAIVEKKITEGIAVSFLQVENESYRHAVPVNSETHFKVVLVSDVFQGMPLIARHRLVNDIVNEELAGTIHALALHTYTPKQWLEKNRKSPDSGKCLGNNLTT